MTDLLSKAFKKASELPDESQDSIAKKLLEIEDELKWSSSFEESKDKLTAMSERALEQSRDSKTLFGF